MVMSLISISRNQHVAHLVLATPTLYLFTTLPVLLLYYYYSYSYYYYHCCCYIIKQTLLS